MIFFTALRKEILELLRTYRLLVAAALLVFFGLTSPLLAKYMRELIGMVPDVGDIALIIPIPTTMDAVLQYIKNIGQFGILLALLLGMGSIAQEKEKGTAAMMLVKPMPRSTFILAKFTALALLFVVTVLLAGLGCYYYTYLLFEALDIGAWLALNALLVLQILVYVALTILCSTLLRTQIAAGGLAVGIMLVLVIFGAIPGLGRYLPGELTNWGMRMIQGDPQSSWTALAISAGIIVVSLVLAIVSFRKQEL
jgi:ABC-2 type transport system permease protein